MIYDSVIRKLSRAQRELIVQHVDRKVPIEVRTIGTRKALVAFGILRFFPYGVPHPHSTELTEQGRRAACLILGDCADMLTAAGLMKDDRVFELLQLWKASRSYTYPAKSPNLKNSTNPDSSSSDMGR